MNSPTFLTLEHAERAIVRSATRRRMRLVSRRLGGLIATVLSCVGIFLILSAPAQYERLVYALDQWLNGSTHNETTSESFNPAQFLGHQPVAAQVQIPDISENQLVIPSIHVRAPILWNIPTTDSLNGLQQGVVQVSESYLPGEAGRTFIVGHSSGFWWLNNPWTKVFVLLDKLADGDLIFLQTSDHVYAYKVVRREIVSPATVSVIRDERVGINELALMTCTPIGTTLNRLVVYAEPIVIESDTGL